MRIDDLILALQRGVSPNAAILAQAQADAGGPVPAPPVAPAPTLLGSAAANANINTDVAVEEERAKAAADAAVIQAGLSPRPAMPGGRIPEPRPRPAEPPPDISAPAGLKTPVTNPIPSNDTPRIMQSPPDLANMYIELIKKNQNAAALDSGLTLIAAGLSNRPENRAALISGAMNTSGQRQLTSADLIALQNQQVKNQELAIRQAAKAGLMKRYKLDRDTLDYLDASGKLDEVIKHQNTGTLVTVEDAATGQKHLVNNVTGQTIATVGGPKPKTGTFVETPEGQRLMSTETGEPIGPAVGRKPSEDELTIAAINAERAKTGQPPVTREEYITTIKRDKPQEPNATDKAALDQINSELPEGTPKVTMQEYITTIKRDPQQPANAADVQTLLQINRERAAKGQPPITMEHYQTNVKREPRAPANEADQLAVEAINADRKAEGKPPITMEHYLTKIKRQGVTVNVGPQGQTFPAPPQGQDYVRNEDGSVKVFEDGKPQLYTVKGAEPLTTETEKKQTEIKEEKIKKEKAKIQQAMTANSVVNATNRALELVNVPGVTGFGARWMRNISPGGTSADSYDAQVASIDANSAVAALQQMRESSPTGGAVGNVTDFEQKMLASTVANLRIAQKSEDAEKALIRIKATFATMLEQRYEGGEGDVAKFNAALKKNIDEMTAENVNKKVGRGDSRSGIKVKKIGD